MSVLFIHKWEKGGSYISTVWLKITCWATKKTTSACHNYIFTESFLLYDLVRNDKWDVGSWKPVRPASSNIFRVHVLPLKVQYEVFTLNGLLCRILRSECLSFYPFLFEHALERQVNFEVRSHSLDFFFPSLFQSYLAPTNTDSSSLFFLVFLLTPSFFQYFSQDSCNTKHRRCSLPELL